MGMVLWSRESVPIKMTWDEWFDHFLSKWMESMRNEWIEVNRGEMRWNEWFEGFDFVNPMGKSLWSVEGVPIKVTWVKVIWSNPIKMNGIDEKWMNRVDRTIWGEMSELKEVTWNNPMGKSLWVERGEPYGSDWNEPYEKVPIKMNGIDEKWMKWSE